jgi:hypothetical protein
VLFSRNRLIAPTLTRELLQLVTELETVFEYNLPHVYSPRITAYRRTSVLYMIASCHRLEHAGAREILTSKKLSLRSCCLYFNSLIPMYWGSMGPAWTAPGHGIANRLLPICAAVSSWSANVSNRFSGHYQKRISSV